MTPRYQVFISSTHNDLIEERKALIQALLKLGCIPAAMEFFQPIDKSLTIIRGVLDNCDYVVLIVAGRYGSVINRKSNNISFTEAEYKYARRRKIPVIPFLLDESILSKLKKSKRKADKEKLEQNVNGQKQLARFRQQLMKEQVQFYKTEKDLPELVANALNEAKIKKPRPGWVRDDQASKLNIIYSAIEKNLGRQTQHREIKPLFQRGKGMSTKLKLAFPLTKRLIGKNNRNVKLLLQQTRTTIAKNARASGIYKRNSITKSIELNPKWVNCELVYAMCHVLENRLHFPREFGDNSFSNMTWWKSPWDKVILYISQICSDKGLAHTVTGLIRDANKHNEKIRSECYELIYRMIISRPSVQIDLFDRVIGEILHISSKTKNN